MTRRLPIVKSVAMAYSADLHRNVIQFLDSASPFRRWPGGLASASMRFKSWLRRTMAETMDGLVDMAAEAFRRLTPGECGNYFSACGYAAE